MPGLNLPRVILLLHQAESFLGGVGGDRTSGSHGQIPTVTPSVIYSGSLDTIQQHVKSNFGANPWIGGLAKVELRQERQILIQNMSQL